MARARGAGSGGGRARREGSGGEGGDYGGGRARRGSRVGEGDGGVDEILRQFLISNLLTRSPPPTPQPPVVTSGRARRGGRGGVGGDGDDGGADEILRQFLITSLLTPPPPPTPQPPVATPTPAMPSNLQADSQQFLAEGEELLRPVNPARLMEVAIHIKPAGDRLTQDAEDRARDPLARRAHLTREEYASRYAAKREDVGRLVRYYTLQHGLRIIPNWSTRLRSTAPFVDRTVRFVGRVGDLNRAFGTTLFRVRARDGGIYTTYRGGLSVPPELDGLVSNVFGLDTRPRVQYQLRLSRPSRRGAPSRVG